MLSVILTILRLPLLAVVEVTVSLPILVISLGHLVIAVRLRITVRLRRIPFDFETYFAATIPVGSRHVSPIALEFWWQVVHTYL